ncbi:MAG: hypothetical protein ACOYIL_06210, partial [Brevibacillus sp.]|jgi:hypothetical protein
LYEEQPIVLAEEDVEPDVDLSAEAQTEEAAVVHAEDAGQTEDAPETDRHPVFADEQDAENEPGNVYSVHPDETEQH